MTNYTFRNDQPDDFLSVLREVGQWLVDSGQELWGVDTLTTENLMDEYTRGNCYVMYVDEVPAMERSSILWRRAG